MPKYTEILELVARELEESINEGPIVDDEGNRLLLEKYVSSIGGCKVSIFSNEHPPPHFHVTYNEEKNSFSIVDCTILEGNDLSQYFRNIRKWHKKNKVLLIKIWNDTRPSNCSVGNYKE